jgi:acetyl-CoA carboxylase biotin carboxyl carrier protein
MSKKIISPLPGVFYRRPAPDKEEFVKVGDEVQEGDVIGLIEVMKNFFELKAEQSGRVEKFLVNNEEVLEAGQEVIELS